MRLSKNNEIKIVRYEELLSQEPNTLVFAALGSLYARKYDFERAIVILDQGLRYFPNYFSARVLLAKCYLAMNHFDAAVAELEKVLSVDPSNIAALGLLGDEFRNRGRYKEARNYYLRILELDSTNDEINYKLHLLDDASGPIEETDGDVPEETDKDVPQESFVTEAGDLETGKEASLSEDAVNLAVPVFGEAEIGNEAKTQSQDIDENVIEAEKTLVATTGVPPSDAASLATITLARIYLDQGLLDQARDILTEILQRNEDNSEAIELLRLLEETSETLSGSGKLNGTTAEGLATGIDTIHGLIENDEFTFPESSELATVTSEIRTVLSSAGIKAQPGYGTNGSFDLNIPGILATDTKGKDNIQLAQKPADIYMIEFSLPDIKVMAGELDVDEFELKSTMIVDNDEFEMDIESPPKKVHDIERELSSAKSTDSFTIETSASNIDSAQFEQQGLSAEIGNNEFYFDLKPTKADSESREAGSTEDGGISVIDETHLGQAPTESTTPDSDTGKITPDKYEGRKLLELDENPFDVEEEDFLGWLNSIKLREI